MIYLIMVFFFSSVLLAQPSTEPIPSEVKSVEVSTQPELVPVELRTAYIPAGFDNNDRVQVVVEGWFPSSCYKVGPHKLSMERGSMTLVIRQYAYRYSGMCLEVVTPFTQVIEIGLLAAATYKVVDGHSNRGLGALPVQFSTRSEPDEFLYASVTDAVVQIRDGKAQSAILEGVFYDSCLRVRDPRVIQETYDVVLILPISEKLNQVGCESGYFPFRRVVPLPQLSRGRYLLHVRSMNGQAINKVFEVVR